MVKEKVPNPGRKLFWSSIILMIVAGLGPFVLGTIVDIVKSMKGEVLGMGGMGFVVLFFSLVPFFILGVCLFGVWFFKYHRPKKGPTIIQTKK